MRIINWLTVPTAAANLTDVIGGSLFTSVNFYAVLRHQTGRHRDHRQRTSVAVVEVSAHRPRGRCRASPSRWSSSSFFVPAALPWYYTWPLAVASALTQSRSAIALIAGFSTWIMVIFKPDGSHGMYSWLHVSVATACAVAAWYSLWREESWRADGRTGAAQ